MGPCCYILTSTGGILVVNVNREAHLRERECHCVIREQCLYGTSSNKEGAPRKQHQAGCLLLRLDMKIVKSVYLIGHLQSHMYLVKSNIAFCGRKKKSSRSSLTGIAPFSPFISDTMTSIRFWTISDSRAHTSIDIRGEDEVLRGRVRRHARRYRGTGTPRRNEG